MDDAAEYVLELLFVWCLIFSLAVEEGELFVPERGSSPDSPDAARGKKKRSRSRSRN